MSRLIARKNLFQTGLCALALLVFGMPPAFSAERPKYSLAVVPQFDSVSINSQWTPLVVELSRRLEADIELKYYASIPRFEEDVVAGGPDLAYMNPYHAVMAHTAQAYIPLLRDDSSQLKGVLVTRKDGPIHTIKDLEGSELVFPAPNAFGASLYMRALLTEEYKLKFSSRYVNSHGNVYRTVILGLANAGGGVGRTLKQEPQEIQDQLNVLYTTPGVPSHPICAHPRVPAEFRDKLAAAIIALAQDPKTAELLTPVLLPKPVLSDYARDYAPLEKLNLDKYVVSE